MAHANHIRFTIPEPCSVPWQSMQPVDELRRHCDTCEAVVTDFRSMSDDELVSFFSQPRGKVCGRLLHSQMDRPMRALPVRTAKAQWWKTLLLLPLALFSKQAKAQYQYARASVTGDAAALAMVQADSLPVQDTAAVAAADTVQVRNTSGVTIAKYDSTYKFVWNPQVTTVSLDSLYWIGPVISSGGCIVAINPLVEFPQVTINWYPQTIIGWNPYPIIDYGPWQHYPVMTVPEPLPWWVGTITDTLSGILRVPRKSKNDHLAASTPAKPQQTPEEKASDQMPGLLPSERKRFFGKA